MRYQPDEDGRYPLNGREYTALCCLIGAINSLTGNKDELRDRLSLLPGGWRDMQLCATLLNKLFEKLLTTIPVKKLRALRREMSYMTCVVKLNPVGKPTDADDIFITNTALRKIVNRAIAMDCTFCEASARECKRCELYRDICECYPCELGKPEDEKCPLAGVTSL